MQIYNLASSLSVRLKDLRARWMQACVLTLVCATAMLGQSVFPPASSSGGGGTWGSITGTLSAQSDLATALGLKLPLAGGTMTGSLLFTDASFDIGASGATRPRDLFLSRDATVGRNLSVGASVVYSSGLPTASAPVVARVGAAGVITYGYKINFHVPAGVGQGIASTETLLLTGNATLDGTNYNTITVPACASSPGATVDIYLVTTDAESNVPQPGFLENVACGATYNHQGKNGDVFFQTPPLTSTGSGAYPSTYTGSPRGFFGVPVSSLDPFIPSGEVNNEAFFNSSLLLVAKGITQGGALAGLCQDPNQECVWIVSQGGNHGAGEFDYYVGADGQSAPALQSYISANGHAAGDLVGYSIFMDLTGGADSATGLLIGDISGATSNFVIRAGIGKVEFDDLKTTGAATGKTIVCVDTSTGILYASSSGVACAN